MATAKKASVKKPVKVTKVDVPFDGGTPISEAPAVKTSKPKPAKFKIPKAMGACADLLYTTRQRRLDLQKQVDALQAQETALREHIIDTLPKSEAKGVAGKVAYVKVETKAVPQVKDWEAFQRYVKKTGAFDLFQRRINTAAIEERWANKKTVPGVESFTAVKVSCTKV